MQNQDPKLNANVEVSLEAPVDLARLCSWARMDDVAYQDFSQQRADRRLGRRVEELPAVSLTPRPVGAAEAAGNTVYLPLEQPVVQAPPIGLNEDGKAGGMRQDTAAFRALAGSTLASIASTITPSVVASSPSAVAGPSWSAAPAELASAPLPLDRPAALAIYSVAGGVGKTTLCANLARSLSALSERVLLVEAGGLGLLPLHFGADQMRPGLRSFCAPGERRASVLVLGEEQPGEAWMREAVEPAMHGVARTLFDLGPVSEGFLDQALAVCQLMLVPVLPDLNSTLTFSRITARLDRLRAQGIACPQVYFVLNRFNQRSELHRRVREQLALEYGEQLLPCVLNASDDVTEALAARMPLADLRPASELAHDFAELARWLQRVQQPELPGQPVRWSEE